MLWELKESAGCVYVSGAAPPTHPSPQITHDQASLQVGEKALEYCLPQSDTSQAELSE